MKVRIPEPSSSNATCSSGADPASDARLPIASGYDLHVIVVCSAGYASSLGGIAARRQLFRATDLIGGFQAWRAAGSDDVRYSLTAVCPGRSVSTNSREGHWTWRDYSR